MVYTLLHVVDNQLCGYETVYAEDRADALRQRPEGWARFETQVRKGLVSYVNG